MAGQATEMTGVWAFNPDPNKEPCTLSMLEKHPELCRNIGWEGVSDEEEQQSSYSNS